jgi:hypothetical protein
MMAFVSGHSEVIGLYSPPHLKEFGTLAEMTADTGLLVPSLAQVSLSVPMMPPGGGGGEVLGVAPDTGAPGAEGPPGGPGGGGEVLGVGPDTGAPGAEGPPGAPEEGGEVVRGRSQAMAAARAAEAMVRVRARRPAPARSTPAGMNCPSPAWRLRAWRRWVER